MSDQLIVKSKVREELSPFIDPGKSDFVKNSFKQQKQKIENEDIEFKKKKPENPSERQKEIEKELENVRSKRSELKNNISKFSGSVLHKNDIKSWQNQINDCNDKEAQLSLEWQSIGSEQKKYEEELKKYEEERKKWQDAAQKNKTAKIDELKKQEKQAESFSFRNTAVKKLYIFPPFLCDDTVGTNFNDDISNKQIYGFSKEDSNKNSIDLTKDILANIPAIDIREYQVDYYFDQIINIFQRFTEGFSTANSASTNEKQTPTQIAAKLTENLKKAPDIFKKIWGKSKDIGGFFKDVLSSFADKVPIRNGYKGSKYKDACIIFPYILYYKLMGYQTLNYYTIPFSGSYDIMKSNGSIGWESDELGISNAFSGAKIVGQITSSFIKNIKISKTPKWKPGSWEPGLSYTISFSLYNYSLEAAINNFLFINTIIPNNLSLQYTLIHQSPCLYDVKIEGGPRMFCCTGEFACTYKGILRSVPYTFINELIGKYKNKLSDSEQAISKNLIKIPDVYNVQCTFKSLLPNNFNEFIWRYAQPTMEEVSGDKGKSKSDSIYVYVMDKISKQVKKLITEGEKAESGSGSGAGTSGGAKK